MRNTDLGPQDRIPKSVLVARLYAPATHLPSAPTHQPSIRWLVAMAPEDVNQYTFSDNINPGTATLTLTGLRNYSGTLVAHFRIVRQEAAGSWQTTGGRWWWRNADGSYPRSCWKQIDDAWYLFDGSGYMLTGWQKVNGTWYYLHGSGAMATGWTKVGGSWYWFNGSGAMQTGWLQLDGTWYWLSSSGAMVTGWQQVSGTWYYFYGSGAMAQSCWVGDYW